MCGIFGLVARKDTLINYKDTCHLVKNLFVLSETRGKESAGISINNFTTKQINVLKNDIPATQLIKSKSYQDFFEKSVYQAFEAGKAKKGISIIAHSRLVTNGAKENNENNQPVIKSSVVMVHNGIVTNTNELWKKYSVNFSQQYEIDTEILLELIRYKLRHGKSISEAVVSTFHEIKGAASVAIQFEDMPYFVLASNTGSLYWTMNKDNSLLVFASEEYILRQILSKSITPKLQMSKINWLKPFTGIVVHIVKKEQMFFDFNKILGDDPNMDFCKHRIVDYSPKNNETSAAILSSKSDSALATLLEYNMAEINHLKRCTKCLLPETFPFISFDHKGVCNYCNNHISYENNPTSFENILEKYRHKEGYDCIAPLSGGRDSMYGLHLLIKEFDMKPLTFTYDWGMVTDLARRNIARICGELGVENILVSANIKKKREYIRKNILAWLKRPELGIIPLFMAGDKYFFSIVNQIKKQTNIRMDIWSANKYENTDFKAAFCGISPAFDKARIDELGWKSKIQMPLYYLQNFLLNPSYFNTSIWDTIGAYKAYYFEPRRDYYLIYDYVNWCEKTIEDTLLTYYDFELSPDTSSTWRIGDGTAAFYNYIYFNVAGFSEIETFRSNQIRDGKMSREEAMQKIEKENQPRLESIKWYCNAIEIDFEQTIKTINNIPKLYREK